VTMTRIWVALLAIALAGCSARKFYDGPERDDAQVVRLEADNAYFFSVDGRSTHAAQEGPAPLLVLPGTHKLIVQLDEERASVYGRVGVPFFLCTQAGRTYTVYPVTDVRSRSWQPAARDEEGRPVPGGPCAGDEALAAAPFREPAAPPAAAPPRPPAAAVPAPPIAAAPAASPPAASAPAPVAPPAAAPVPAPATPAAPTDPGALAAGGQARLRAAARTRALADAPAVKGLEPGATVTLKVKMKKDTGTWWYVKGDAASGWVLEAELAAASAP
jgi:hypothetical protein